MRRRDFGLMVSALLAGCGSGGDGNGTGYCQAGFVGGSSVTLSTAACNNCEVNNEGSPTIDGNAGSFATLTYGVGGGQLSLRAVAPAGTAFPAGANAGALMQFPGGTFTNVGVRFNSYRSGSPVGTAEGGEFTNVGSLRPGMDHYYNVSPSGEFDTLEAVVSLSGNAEATDVRLYEFCGHR